MGGSIGLPEGVLIPIVCQAEHCNRVNWMPFGHRGWYAFYFRASDYDKHRMRISRSPDEIAKEVRRVSCELCGEETAVFLMRKQSAQRFQRVSSEVPMVQPGQMRLPGEESDLPHLGAPIVQVPDFIEIELEYRIDKVFSSLIDEINTCFEYEAYSSAMVMTRKLIENLIVDILRVKYGPTDNHEMYFDDDCGHFLQLNELVSNFEKISSQYKKCGLTSSHLATIKGLRKKGNHSAHSIVDFMSRPKMESIKTNANAAVSMLLRIIGIERGRLDKDGGPMKKK